GIIHRGQPHCTQRALKSVCTTIITDPAVHTFFLQRSRALPALHSFPTRRSSDLNAIVRRGYTPVFVDIDPETFNLSPDAVSETLSRTPGVQGLLMVHLYGLPCRMGALMEIAKRHHLTVIEDAAQAHGAAVGARKVGTFGAAAAFSFYPSKNLTTGEGGMVVTDDPGLAERARMLINVGQSSQYVYEMLGSNYRMTEIAAAIGIGQLARLDEHNARRRQNAKALTAG